ncbi:hypothetical protein EYZ11_011550 [Aspergillus tanneri]|nr:hypothetical protein EYZ11_011550 [Aspergillus tanneri]
MALYEVYNPSGIQGWTHQVRLGCELLEKRGLPRTNETFDRNLYRRLRNFALYHSCGGRKPTFLGRPEWRAILGGDSHDELLDILLQMPALMELMDGYKKRYGQAIPDSLLRHILREFRQLEVQLLQWYWRLQCKETVPLFDLQYALPTDERFVTDETSQIAFFSQQHLFELLMLYWLGCVVLYTFGAEVPWQMEVNLPGPTLLSEAVKVPNADTTLTALLIEKGGIGGAEESEQLAAHFAHRVCQSVAFCMRPGFAMAGLQILMTPVWAAKQFFLHRTPGKVKWCQMALDEMGSRGVKLAKVIRNISQDQYAAMKETNWLESVQLERVESGDWEIA